MNKINEILEKYKNGERDFSSIQLDDQIYDFSGLDLRGVNFSNSWIFANFSNSDLSNSNFEGANIKTCVFEGANLKHANFSQAKIESAIFKNTEMENTIFLGASCYGHVFGENEKPEI